MHAGRAATRPRGNRTPSGCPRLKAWPAPRPLRNQGPRPQGMDALRNGIAATAPRGTDAARNGPTDAERSEAPKS